MINPEELVKIGSFAKPHGIKGEIGLVTTYDIFDASDDPYIVCCLDGIYVPFYIESYRQKSATVTLVKLETVDTEASARRFTRLDAYFPRALMPEEELEEAHSWDVLIGYTLSDARKGFIGIIEDVDTSTENALLKVNHEGREMLLPIAGELIRSVDDIDKRLVMDLPEGLLEL